jgi:hypothetical protein
VDLFKLEILTKNQSRCRRCFSITSRKKGRDECLPGLFENNHIDGKGFIKKEHWRAYKKLYFSLLLEKIPKIRNNFRSTNGYLWEHPGLRSEAASSSLPSPGITNYLADNQLTDGRYSSLSIQRKPHSNKNEFMGIQRPKSISSNPMFGNAWYEYLLALSSARQLYNSYEIFSPKGDTEKYGFYRTYASFGLVFREPDDLVKFWSERVSDDLPGIYIAITDKQSKYTTGNRKYKKQTWGSYCGESKQLPHRIIIYENQVTDKDKMWVSTADNKMNMLVITDARPAALSIFSNKDVRLCLERLCYEWVSLARNRCGKMIGEIREPPRLSAISIENVAQARLIFGHAVEPLLRQWIEDTLGVSIDQVIFTEPLH